MYKNIFESFPFFDSKTVSRAWRMGDESLEDGIWKI
jgi:hypothetical protein